MFTSKHAGRLQENMFEFQKSPTSQGSQEKTASPPVFAPSALATKNMTTSLRSWGENSWRKLLRM